MAKFFHETVHAFGGFSGDRWDVNVGYNQTYTSETTAVTFTASTKRIELSSGTFPAWFVVGQQFTTDSINNPGLFSVAAVISTTEIEVRETVVDEAGVTVEFDGSMNTEIQDVLLSAGNGALEASAPLVLTSTGALGAARQLDISALEAESTPEGAEPLRGRIFLLSVQNTDILTNAITVVSSSTINGAASLVIDTLGEYLFYHIAGGVWRAVILPLPADALATIARVPFTAADWDDGATNNTIKILQTGTPAAGEVGPHGLTAYGSYVVTIINTDLTPDEEVDVEKQFESNGDITIRKAGGLDFNGVAVIVGSLD